MPSPFTAPVRGVTAVLLRTAAITALLACVPTSPAGAQTWGAGGVDVWTLDMQVHVGGIVNDLGQVAGRRYNYATRGYDAVGFDPVSGERYFGSLSAPGRHGWVTGINNSGEVVGYGDHGQGNSAFLHDGTSMRTLGGVWVGSTRQLSNALGINDLGHVVGTSYNGSFWEPYLYDGSRMVGIGSAFPSGGSLSITGFNDAGQIVGKRYVSAGVEEAFIHDGTSYRSLAGLANPSPLIARDINDSGHVVGLAGTGSDPRAFVYDGATVTGLSTQWSQAFGIDNQGRVVGEESNRAVLWESGSKVFLDALVGGGWTFERAVGISDNGSFIVAEGAQYDEEGRFLQRSYVLLGASTVAPEPGTLVLLGTGLAGLAGVAARRRRRLGTETDQA